MKLSNNFSLEELTTSQTAVRNGFSNNPNEKHMQALQSLVSNLLQPMREALGKPVVISSGYRSPTLNKLIGGSSRSQHSVGEAADFTVIGMTTLDVCKWIVESGMDFDQLIYEGGWVHISYKANGQQRKQVLTAHFSRNGVSYSTGLPS